MLRVRLQTNCRQINAEIVTPSPLARFLCDTRPTLSLSRYPSGSYRFPVSHSDLSPHFGLLLYFPDYKTRGFTVVLYSREYNELPSN